MAGGMVYRFRAQGHDDAWMRRFRTAMATLQSRFDNRGYNHIAGFHGAPDWYCWHHQFSQRAAARAQLFLPWHRAYLWHLEQALQDIDPEVSLPWWDWSRDLVPTSFNDLVVDGMANPLASFTFSVPATTNNSAMNRRTSRAPGAVGVSLPSAFEVEQLLQETDYSSFNDGLEDFHDRVHVWVNGDMASVATAAYDPIFFVHHCMVDRIWYLWQLRHGQTTVPNDLLDMPLAPFSKTVRQVLNVHELGYEYAAEGMIIDNNDSPTPPIITEPDPLPDVDSTDDADNTGSPAAGSPTAGTAEDDKSSSSENSK